LEEMLSYFDPKSSYGARSHEMKDGAHEDCKVWKYAMGGCEKNDDSMAYQVLLGEDGNRAS